MRKHGRRGLAFLVGLCLLFGIFPGTVSGQEEDAAVISPGETVEVSAGGENGVAYLMFTPERSGFYVLFSEGDRDPFCQLFNDEWSQITYDDDSGDDRNFCLSSYLEAGKCYYYRISLWSAETPGMIPVTLLEPETRKEEFAVGEMGSFELGAGMKALSVTFTPDRTEQYRICFTGYSYIYAMLLNGDGEVLGTCGHSGWSGSVAGFEVELCEGESYTIELCVDGNGQAPFQMWTEICHDYTAVVEKEKTCADDGLLLYTCRYCNESYTEILPGGHEYTGDGVCTLCGELIRDSGSCGENVFWSLEGSVLTVYGQGEMDDCDWYTQFDWVAHQSYIKTIVVEDGVTSIGEYAFYGLYFAEEIILGSNVQKIGGWAFSHCEFKEMTIPASVTEISGYAFASLNRLERLYFEGDAPVFAEDAFCDTGEYTVYYPHGNDSWTEDVLQGYGSDDIVWEVIHIYGSWYETERPTVDTYGVDARVCTVCGHEETRMVPSGACGEGLMWVLRDGILTVSGAGELTGGWSGIDYEICAAVTEVVVEEGVTALNVSLSELSRLTRVSLPQSLTAIGSGVFWGCDLLTEVEIPHSVTEIGRAAFYGCRSLERIVIPEGVTCIAERTFLECTSLTEVSLPHTLEKIEEDAFYSCGLTILLLPERVEYIGSGAFAGCASLETVFVLGDRPRFANADAFAECPLAVCCFDPDSDRWEEEEWLGLPLKETEICISGDASCTEGGAYTVSCPEWEFSQTREVGALGHRYGERILHREPSDAQTGLWMWQCESCGQQEFTEIPAWTEVEQTPTQGSGSNSQNYSTWAGTIDDYLVENGDGSFSRVTYDWENGVRIEQYDGDFTYLSSKTVEMELPVFGGYYTDGEYHYLVFGQNNGEENDETEVVRLVVYDRDWNRINCASRYGSNTTVPFRAGCVRMTLAGGLLYIHTSHRMYTSGDGLQHQSNMTLWIPRFELLEFRDDVILNDSSDAYASHSFNQFIEADGDVMYMVDHGDAYPRTVVITILHLSEDGYGYRTRYDSFGPRVNVLDIAGATGDNYTGVSVGGFAISESSLLVAGNSVDQEQFDTARQRNIFLTVTSKDAPSEENTQIIWLTSYEDQTTEDGLYSSITVTTPHLVEIDDNRFCILWTEYSNRQEDTLCYTFLNGEGQVQGEVYRAEGTLSECVPIVSGGKLVWLVANYECGPDFYAIDLDDPTQITCIRGHAYTRVVTEPTCTERGYTTCTCECGESYVGSYVDALGHDYVSSVVEVTCTQRGYTEHICRTCGHSYRSDYVEITCPSYKFRDVDRASWYHPYVDFVVERGLMNGTSATTFAPTTNITRASVAVMLWNLAGKPEHSVTENPFNDVPSTWYTNAVLWAYEKGIVAGNGAGGFNSNNDVTREQLAVMLFNFAKFMGYDLPATKDVDLNSFPDGDKVSGWASSCLKWACDLGLINGKAVGGQTLLAPKDTATRAEIAVIFTNFTKLVEAN